MSNDKNIPEITMLQFGVGPPPTKDICNHFTVTYNMRNNSRLSIEKH